jgi:hypothetical protein
MSYDNTIDIAPVPGKEYLFDTAFCFLEFADQF